MAAVKKGESHIATRARLMLLLGEQLITDEIAAVSELVKNSYDADAEEVKVSLWHIANPEEGYISVWDNGNGMSLEKVLSSWLELGTLSKARVTDRTPRLSEIKKRIILGEKGLGRLAVHKLGYITTLVTRRMGENVETKLTIDWTLFEQEGFLEQVPIKWEVTKPQVYKDFPKGTCLIIKKLRRAWTPIMVKNVKENILALKAPFKDFADFSIKFTIDDEEEEEKLEMTDLIKSATYIFKGKVDEQGSLTYDYYFTRSDLDLKREELSRKCDIRSKQMLLDCREPTCGPFEINIYSWDASLEDLKAVLGETSIYKQMIRPNSGVKLFRDGFRVYPYGNSDNDWLGMDARRIGSFEMRISRNQVIGAIDISSKSNPCLTDKTDREGLICNQAYEDFIDLVLGAISSCETERFKDRRKLKEVTGRIRLTQTDKSIYSQNLASLSSIVGQQDKISGETKLAINKLIDEARSSLENILSESEQPLLVAASFGITYLLPTHEIKRNIDESLKLLGRIRKTGELDQEKLSIVISNLQQASSITNGLARLGIKTRNEAFYLRKAAEEAINFMKDRLFRNNVKCDIEGSDKIRAKGKENLITMTLLNFLDNSVYWLLRKKTSERQIKILVGEYLGKPTLIVSDNGPGFEDDISLVTLPFFTRKPDGMGLGLYIADRISKMNGGHLLLLEENDFPGLLSGANIAISLNNVEEKLS